MVDTCDEDRLFTWHAGGPGYRITALHRLEPCAGGTSVDLEVEMTGVLASLLWVLVGRTARQHLDAEAAALKKHCEALG